MTKPFRNKNTTRLSFAAALLLSSSLAAVASCGDIPTVSPDVSDDVFAAVPASYAQSYNGYALPVSASPWAGFKSSKDGDYKIAILWGPLDNDTQVAFVESAEAELGKFESVGEVVVRSASSNDAIAQQVQQFNALVAEKVDAIITQPLSSEAMVLPIEAAQKAGIPVIVLLSPVSSPSAINVGANNFMAGADVASGLVKIMDGKGTLLTVHSIPGIQLDKDIFAGLDAVLDSCPDITRVGELSGFFAPPVAKGETLKYLATHSSTKIDGVFQGGGGMAGGIISAFMDAQMEVPPVGELGASKAHLGYWNQNKDTYKTVGAELIQGSLARASVSVSLRVLSGQGLQISSIVDKLPVITEAELSDWVDPSWDLNTPGSASGPDDNPFLSEAYLDGLFANVTMLK